MGSIDAMIDRTLELDAKATPITGPLEPVSRGDGSFDVAEQGGVCFITDHVTFAQRGHFTREDAYMWAEYRTLCPALARELRETREQLAKLEEAYQYISDTGGVEDVMRAFEALAAWREAKEGKVSE